MRLFKLRNLRFFYIFLGALRPFFLTQKKIAMRIQLSALVDNMAGSLNGSAIRRSRYGLVLQNKAHISRNINNKIASARALFGSVSAIWRGMLESERYQWNEIAAENPQTDRFGNEIFLSGYAYFVKVHMGYGFQYFGILDGDDYQLVPTTVSSAQFEEAATDILQLKITIAAASSDYVLHAGLVPALDSLVKPFKKKISACQTIQFDKGEAALEWDKAFSPKSNNGGVAVVYWLSHRFGWISTEFTAWYQWL